MPDATTLRPAASTAGVPAVRRIGPGLLVSLAGAALAVALSLLVPAASPMLVAIVLGAVLANATPGGLPDALAPGLAVSSRRLLRLGVVLLGLQLVLGDIWSLGGTVVVGVVAIVGGTVAATIGLGRLLRVDRTQTLLIAAGFSICGAAAVAGMEGVLTRRKDEEAATAVALVVVFGTGMIAIMPALTALLGLDPRTAGIWAGGSIHEVAQVVAAAGIIGGEALKVAIVVKLARVLLLVPVLGVVSWHQRSQVQEAGRAKPPLVPLFVVAFLAMVVVRSFGIVPDAVLAAAKLVQSWLLAAAMFALGTSAHHSVLRRTGGRPVLLAAASTLVVITLAGVVAVAAR